MLKEISRYTSKPILRAARVRIYLLGPLRIEQNDQPIHLPRRKVDGLLAYLLLHPEQHTRDGLAARFWGDSSDDKARHSLRTALATLRQYLGDSLLLANREQVQINPDFPIWVDLFELLALEQDVDAIDLTNPARIQSSLALWQGELLSGTSEDWVTTTREHYHTRLITLCLTLTQRLRAQSEYLQAIEVAQKVLVFDPANEQAHQHLMFCYMAAGDRPAALRQYDQIEQLLESEFDASPMPETTALYHWIRQREDETGVLQAKITNLPIPLTSFIGRTRQTSEVKRLLTPLSARRSIDSTSLHPRQQTTTEHRKSRLLHSDSDKRWLEVAIQQHQKTSHAEEKAARLLTLVGAGGSGKTRLAIQVATDLIDSFAYGVWWVELAALSLGEQIARTVAKALGVSQMSHEPTIQSITNFVSNKHLLLVIDNAEHLIEPVAHLADELLRQCPNLQLLITSREALNIHGELLWQVPTLDLPDREQEMMFEQLMSYECIRLFVERASAAQASLRLTAENAEAIAEICVQLDGIPLAIELAAARVKVLPVEEIAALLTGVIGARFDLLTQGSRVAQPRQQTLRAALDWSYNLLDDTERLLFRQLAIFRGGFTLEAIEQVVTFDEGRGKREEAASSSTHFPRSTAYHLPSTVLDLLTQLVDKSLVIVELQGDQNRYRLLETVREYALGQFHDKKDMSLVQRRHVEYFLRLAEQAEPALIGPHQQRWLNQLEIEHPNLRAALDYLIANGDGEAALRLATAIYRFWDFRGYVSEGYAWLRKALIHRNMATSDTQARALNAVGWLAYRQGNLEQARQFPEEALFLFEQIEEEIGIADSLQQLAIIEMDEGDYATAQQRLEQSLSLSRMYHHDYYVARALSILGALAWDQDRFIAARDYYLESLCIYQRTGDQVNIANRFLNIGDTERMLDNVVAARTNYEECLKIAHRLGHKGLIGASLKSLGMVAVKQQAYDQACSYGEEALQIFRALGDKAHTGFALALLGDVAHKLGQSSKALSYFCQNLQIMHEVGYKWPTFVALEDIARLLTEADQQPELAAQFLGAADGLRQEAGIAVPADQQAEYDRISTTLRQQLGDTLFDRLWQAGQTTPLDQIVAEATSVSLT